MKWTLKLVAEAQLGTRVEQEVITIEREDLITPATVGLTIAEGKAIMESLQRRIVTEQVQRHGSSIKSCSRCWKSFRTKGYYQSTLRSVYGKVPMRIRRVKGCPARNVRSAVTRRSALLQKFRTRKNVSEKDCRFVGWLKLARLPAAA